MAFSLDDFEMIFSIEFFVQAKIIAMAMPHLGGILIANEKSLSLCLLKDRSQKCH